jgi:hypothetical protein
MKIQGPTAARVQDITFFGVFLAYAWVGIDTRLIYHWQGPIFSTIPGFLHDFLMYPGGLADYLGAAVAQAYAFQGWGAIVLTAQVAAVVALTQVFFTTLAGRALPLVRFVPAVLLLYFSNLYYDRTPILPALSLGLALAICFVPLSRRWRNEAGLLAAYLAMLLAAYYLGGMAIVFFAPAAAAASSARRPRFPLWIAYLLLAAALPAAVELFHLSYVPVSARDWFAGTDVRRIIVCWGLYVFYAVAAAVVLWRRPAASAAAAVPRKASRSARRERTSKRRPAALPATALLLLALGCVATVSYRLNSRDRRMAALDYYSFREDWRAVIEASHRLAAKDFNMLSRYEVNLALYETNRLGDDMFRFPQSPPVLLDLRVDMFLPYMIRLTDMCLRLGRVNEAEHFGSEGLIVGRSDPRLYRLMALINTIKGQTAAARKFLTALSYDVVFGTWARQRLRELDRDPQLAGDPQIQSFHLRMLRNDDMLQVWQRADLKAADWERLLLDQLEQYPANRMAFEFLMSAYLLGGKLDAVSALMPRIKDMSGPAYVGDDGKRRTPRHYQEAMALHADQTGRTANIEGFEIQPETFERLTGFNRIVRQSPGNETAMRVAWDNFRDTYFFYFTFGPGDYR